MNATHGELAAVATAEEVAAGHFRGHDFSGRSFRDADLSRLTFEGCNFTGADLSGARMATTTFRDCRLVGASLRGASVSAGAFERCDLSDVDACDIDLSSVRLAGCTAHRARFDRAEAPKSESFESSLRDSSWRHANLTAARFSNCDLGDAHLDGSTLTRAMLMRCELGGASFAGATVLRMMVSSPQAAGPVAAPRDPWDIYGAGSEQLFATWNLHRAAPGTIERPVDDELVMLEMLDAKPELASILAAESPVFGINSPWFKSVKIAGVIADKTSPPRLVFGAALSDDERLVLEQDPASLAAAAAAEGISLGLSDAVEYARFAAYVVYGRLLPADAPVTESVGGWTVGAPGFQIQVQPTGAVRVLQSNVLPG